MEAKSMPWAKNARLGEVFILRVQKESQLLYFQSQQVSCCRKVCAFFMLLRCLHFEFETGLTSIIWDKCVPEVPAINETRCSNDSSRPVLKLCFPLFFEDFVKGDYMPLLLQHDGLWALTWLILPLKSAQDRANSDVAGSRSLSFRLEGTPTPWNSIEIFQQLLWKRNFMGHKLLLQPEIHFRSGQVTTLRKKVTEALTGRPWIAGTLWPEAAGGWQQNQLPEFSDSTLLQKNVSHLVPEQHLILHLQHLLLHLRESSVNQWRHQWSELIRNRQSASRFQRKFKFQQAFAAHLPRFLLEFEEGGVDHLDRELVGRKSSMEWCWDLGEKVCSFTTGMTLQLQILLPKFCDLYENPKCAMCKSWLSATCGRSLARFFDLQLLVFLHLATGCNHECKCKECLAKHEVSPAPPRMPTPPQKRLQRTSETSCNSVQLRSPLRPQWNHVRTKKIQKWNTLNSQHGGLGRCSFMFFRLVSSVGPLWVHVVDRMPKKHQ